jgi:hypothetical protein
MILLKRSTFLILLCTVVFSTNIFGQSITLKGKVSAADGNPLLGASVIIPAHTLGIVTDEQGRYSFLIPFGNRIFVECSFLGYSTVFDTLYPSTEQTTIVRNFVLTENTREIDEVEIGVEYRKNTSSRINLKPINQLPSSGNNIENMLKSFAVVQSNNELSSQYSVRGGNYDENLVYVNDIEIFRPMLVQSAQQEGLSFVNPNMVSSIQFSAGGFEAEYGDKMSSVLDIQYLKPTKFIGNVSASLLGANLHFAGTDNKKKFTYNTGIRYKTTRYLLSSLDVTGEYSPIFGDAQTYLTYELSPKSSISILGNYSTNQFSLIPETRSTDFGTISQTLNFTVFYDGQEYDRFDSYLGAFTYTYNPVRDVSLKFIASGFQTHESITYDILSEYWINQISRGSANNDTTINIGTGGTLEHARNFLTATVRSIEHKGMWNSDLNTLKWGLKVQYESIDDKLKEWRFLDSAGMAAPFSNEVIGYDFSVSAKHNINSYRYQAFLQNTNTLISDNCKYSFTYGIRANYWDFNHELLISPRLAVSIKPYWQREINFYFASGLYGQPPFYKELKDYTGRLYPDKRAQKSIHFVTGTDIHYNSWDRPFVFSAEIYYKYLYQITPYKVDNIRVEYMPQYEARGYAAGIDLRVTGEFVPGVDSWFSLSLLETREDTYNDYYKLRSGEIVYPASYRRPSDQRLAFSVFFQDYLPSNPDYKVHLLMNYGTGLPYSGPQKDRPSQVFLLNQYRRVDIGFSRLIRREKHAKIGFNDIWLSLEILNLLDAPNMSSFDWVRTVENNEGYSDFYAIPNYLTGRRFNIKISSNL